MGRLLTSLAGATPAYLRSVQQVSITIPAGSTSATATISAVDTAKTAVLFQGVNSNNAGAAPAKSLARIELTDATTVTAYRNTSDASITATVQAVIFEGTSALIKSVQHGTITVNAAGTSNTATVNSVATGKAALVWLGQTTTETSDFAPENFCPRITLTNSTTVTANRAGNGSAVTVGFCLIEFAPAAVASVEQRSVTFNNTNSSNTDTVSNVAAARTILLGGGMTANDIGGLLNYCATLARFELTDATTVTFTDATTYLMSVTYNYTVVQFATGVIRSLQRGSISLASAAQADGTVSSVNTAKAVVISNSCVPTSGSSNYDRGLSMVKLQSATAVRANRGNATGTATAGFQLVEFL